MPKTSTLLDPELNLLSMISKLVVTAKENIIAKANFELVLLNWHIGRLVKSQILSDQRSEYGEKIVATLSQQLTLEFGRGFNRSALFRMIQFYWQLKRPEIKMNDVTKFFSDQKSAKTSGLTMFNEID